jgi:hypothetical protein
MPRARRLVDVAGSLVELEPADGEIAPNQALDPNNFLSPEES